MTKISQLSSIGDSLAIGDQFLIRDIDDTGSPNKSVTVSGITRALDTGTALAPAIAFAGDKNTGIYSPGADTLAFVEGGTEVIRIDSSGRVGIGTTSPGVNLDVASTTPTVRVNATGGGTPSLSLFSAGVYDWAVQGGTALKFTQDSTERARIDSSGRVGIGTSSPGAILHTTATSAGAATIGAFLQNSSLTAGTEIRLGFAPNTNTVANDRYSWIGAVNGTGSNDSALTFATTPGGAPGVERMRIDSSGRVGIGTSSPASLFHMNAPATGGGAIFSNQGYNYATISQIISSADAVFGGGVIASDVGGEVKKITADVAHYIKMQIGEGITFHTNITGASGTSVARATNERMRIDSSGRLLVGTSSGRLISSAFLGGGAANAELQVEGTSLAMGCFSSNRNDSFGPYLALVKSRGTTANSFTLVNNGDIIGALSFNGTDGSAALAGAAITAFVDGTPGANDMPGRLVFSTTADGAASPTERMRITSGGAVGFGGNNGGEVYNSSTTNGFYFAETGGLQICRNEIVAFFNRRATDGTIVSLRQDGTEEGAISVSGTTVTYGGGHLARWSQLPNDEDPSGLLKGTVMSNLDEMCKWGDENNEQLNKTIVSDVEGDANVAGVFVSTSFSDDGPLDYFVAMTGDMIIRIAEGILVQRGDLLMSAGDGTAKPQDDDIIRSKTIAKVTSTNVSCTYEDGSYCVPCVLMAC